MPRRGPLIGRDLEQAELGAVLAEAASGRGGVVLVAGEAGVGKTRLVESMLGAAGLRVLRGHAVEEATPPFGPVAAALRGPAGRRRRRRLSSPGKGPPWRGPFP